MIQFNMTWELGFPLKSDLSYGIPQRLSQNVTEYFANILHSFLKNHTKYAQVYNSQFLLSFFYTRALQEQYYLGLYINICQMRVNDILCNLNNLQGYPIWTCFRFNIVFSWCHQQWLSDNQAKFSRCFL